MANNSLGTWTPARDEALRAAWATKATAPEIAAQLGGFEHTTDGGKNSVIGRAHRLKLESRAPATRALDPEERDRRLQARYEIVKARRHAKREAELTMYADAPRAPRAAKPAKAPKPEAPPYVPQGISFAELRDFSSQRANQCRYIDAADPGPNFFYCGSETLPGESYCGHCAKICRGDQRSTAVMSDERRERLRQQGRTAGYASIKKRGLVMGRSLASATAPILDIEARV